MTVQLIYVCLTIAPIFLLFTGALGVFKIMSVGPAEFPKDHPVNTTLSYILLVSALGLFIFRFSTSEISRILGSATAVICIIAYAVTVARHRKDFPHKPTEEIYRETKERMEKRARENPIKWVKKKPKQLSPDQKNTPEKK